MDTWKPSFEKILLWGNFNFDLSQFKPHIDLSWTSKATWDTLQNFLQEKSASVDMNQEVPTLDIWPQENGTFVTRWINGCTIISMVARYKDGSEKRFLRHYDTHKLDPSGNNKQSVLPAIQEFRSELESPGDYDLEYAIFTPQAVDAGVGGCEFQEIVQFLNKNITTLFPESSSTIISYESDLGKQWIQAPTSKYSFYIKKFDWRTYFLWSNGFKKELFV